MHDLLMRHIAVGEEDFVDVLGTAESIEFRRRWAASRDGFNPSSDAIGSERREAIELHRGVAGGVGASREKIERIADRQIERQTKIRMLIDDIGAIAGRARKNHLLARPAVMRCANAIMNALAKGLRQAVVPSGVDINPAPPGVMRFSREEQYLAAQDAGVTDHVPPRLEKQLRPNRAEMRANRTIDRPSISGD